MTHTYVEFRKVSTHSGRESVAADVMRHLHTRQYLGKTVVICEQPTTMLSAARKQWLKLSRGLQRHRASTLNADKILKYTHGIAYMQRLKFCAKQPLDQPDADVFFLRPEELGVLPAQCFTLYLTQPVQVDRVGALSAQLPAGALYVDYLQMPGWEQLGVEPKKRLEMEVAQQWQQACSFLDSHHVNISALHKSELHDIEAMDDALDILLGISQQFLTIAGGFQRALELARPMRIHKTLHEKYDSLILLAHRVQALTPGAFSQQFLQVYNEDDTFFFHDNIIEDLLLIGESHHEAFTRHMAHGRKHLAHALHERYIGRSFQPSR